MIRRSTLRRLIAGFVGAGALAASTIAAGAAAADQTVNDQLGMRCYSLNPNILDFPSFQGVNVQRDAGDNTFWLSGDSKSFFPYASDTRITVTQLPNGPTHTYYRHWTHSIGDNSGYQIYGIPGRGKVKITINAVDHGLLTLHAPECSAVTDLK